MAERSVRQTERRTNETEQTERYPNVQPSLFSVQSDFELENEHEHEQTERETEQTEQIERPGRRNPNVDCTHTFITTTSDLYLKCEKCGAISKAKTLEALRRQKPLLRVARSNREMFVQRQKPDYVDYRKAERDLRNYWQ